jgi:leader peptidase (prepilin peptidase) / N-methyltransferase
MTELWITLWPYLALAVSLAAACQPWLLRRLAVLRKRDIALTRMGVALPPLRRNAVLAACLILAFHLACLGTALAMGKPPLPAPVLIGLGVLSMVLAITDWRALWLPDALVLPLGLIGFFVSIAAGIDWLMPVIGAVAGYFIFLALRLGYRMMRGVEGLGGGDVHLAAAMGAWTGPEGLSLAVFIACLLALASVPLLYGRGAGRQSRLPLGSYLVMGLFAAETIGPLILP